MNRQVCFLIGSALLLLPGCNSKPASTGQNPEGSTAALASQSKQEPDGDYFFLGLLSRLGVIVVCERSEGSQVMATMRSLATAIEQYYVDHNVYPAWSADAKINAFGPLGEDSEPNGRPTFRSDYGCGGPMSLTTPFSYIMSYDVDVFAPIRGATFNYWSTPSYKGDGFIIWSPGPDKDYDLTLENVEIYYDPRYEVPSPGLIERQYDPTNGARSGGDVFRTKQ